MASIPKDVFEPKAGTKTLLRRWRLPDPWVPPTYDPHVLVDNGTIRANEITPDDEIPAGQEFEEVSFCECQFVLNSEEVIGTADGCTIYKVLYVCSNVTETWWLRHPSVRVFIKSDPDSVIWKAAIVCPDGSWSVAPAETWPVNGTYDPKTDPHAGEPGPTVPKPKQPVYLPPHDDLPPDDRPIIVTSGTGLHKGHLYIQEDNFWEIVPPFTIEKCWYTAKYKKRVRIKTLDLNTNKSTTEIKDSVPETFDIRKQRIPGCIDEEPHAANPQGLSR